MTAGRPSYGESVIGNGVGVNLGSGGGPCGGRTRDTRIKGCGT